MQNLIKFLAVMLIAGMVGCGGSGEGESADNGSTETKTETKSEQPAASSANVPASQRVDLENKGIGPITNIDLPAEIDRKLAVEGKEVYDTKCIACHNVETKLIGPPQKGILERRSPEWVMNMIMNPTEMLEKDPLAKDLLEEFNNTPMLDQNIPEEEARALVEYFRTL